MLRKKNIIGYLTLIISIVLATFIAEHFFFRIDLTSDKRFTISKSTKEILENIEDVVYIRIYLEGEMPIQMKKFQRSVKDMLDEFRRYAGNRLQYDFRNPSEGSEEQKINIYNELIEKGLTPLSIHETDTEGGTTRRTLFPGAILNYKQKEYVVNFIQTNLLLSSEENTNYAEQNLEYELINAIHKLSLEKKEKIAFIHGHGELDRYETGDIFKELSGYYEVNHVEINGDPFILDGYKVAIIAKPISAWPEEDKFAIDQFIMNGGATAWFIDPVIVHEDSLAKGENTFGVICEHNLSDQLFVYGTRLNTNVIQDQQAADLLINVAYPGSPPEFQPFPWTYFPLLSPPSDNFLTKGLNLVRSQYPGVIDTVGKHSNVKKEFILYSSEHSMVTQAPLIISLSQINEKITDRKFYRSHLPVAALLTGEFNSPFAYRDISRYVDRNFNFKKTSVPTKMVVIADGDIIRNDVAKKGNKISIYTLGYDKHSDITYGNKDFVKNIINYLAGDDKLMQARNRDFKMRLLDRTIVAEDRSKIILVNTLGPIVFVIVAGVIFVSLRKRKYTR